MGNTEPCIPPTETVLTSRGFYCFKCLGDGTVPLYVMFCGHCAHKECLQRVWHDYDLFLGGRIYCTVCCDTFDIRAVYRTQRGSYHPRHPGRN